MDGDNSNSDQQSFHLAADVITCDFKTVPFKHPHWKFKHRCRNCGTIRYDRLGHYVRACDKPEKAKCPHLGKQTRNVRCRGCKGYVLLKVHECAVLGECCVGKKTAEDLPTCVGCPHHPARLVKERADVVDGLVEEPLGPQVGQELKHNGKEGEQQQQGS